MVYSDTTGKQGIVQDAYWEAGADSNSYPIADVTRQANIGLDEAVTIILGADGKWNFDDTNATDLPIGATDLITGQNDYSFDEEYLAIRAIEMITPQGNWTKLIPLDNTDLQEGESFSALETGTGVPTHYKKMGSSIILIPTPNYNYRLVEEGTAGIRAFFQRNISYFVVGDTTKTPGFAGHLHKFLSLHIAEAYCRAKEKYKKADALLGQKVVWGEKIRAFYSFRQLDTKKRIENNIRVKR